MNLPQEAVWAKLNLQYLDHAEGLGKDRIVMSAVIVCKGKALLVRRAMHDTYPGVWEFPGGGVEDHEKSDLVEALRREVKEETGIDLPQFPTDEVLTHPTRTAYRVVLRFDLDEEPEHIVLSHEHDGGLFVDVHGAREAYVDGANIYENMRDESRAILETVSSEDPQDKSIGQDRTR